VAAIAHQNVVPIYAVDVHNGHPYIAMQYVAGASLQQRLDMHGPLQVAEIVRIAAQIAQALAAAHAQGIVHRDIKPANILLESNVDRVLVTDFGFARVIDDASTHSGAVTGTPQYMSPEKCQGRAADQRSDLFSLGSVLYAMCVGRSPFRSETLMGMLRKVCDATPREVRELNSDIPTWLETLVFRLLEKHPDDRFDSASQVAEILEEELAHLQNPTAVGVPNRTWMPSTQTPLPRSRFSRTLRMLVTTFACSALLVFSFAQLSGDAPSAEAPSSQQTESSSDQTPLIISEDENGAKVFESKIDRLFDVEEGGQFNLKTADGDVEITGGDAKQVRVQVFRRVVGAAAEADARQLLSAHDVQVDSKGSVISVWEAEPRQDSEETDDSAPSLQILYKVLVPKSFNATVRSSDGDVKVTTLAGTIRLASSDGDLLLRDVHGDLLAKTSDGDILAADCTGTQVLATSDGDVLLNNCDGDVTASTEDGEAMLKDCDGNLVVASDDGDVHLEQCTGNIITSEAGKTKNKIRASTGDANATVLEAGKTINQLRASTGDANVAVLEAPAAAVETQAERNTPEGVPGNLVAVEGAYEGGVVDGYTLYLPRSYSAEGDPCPVLIYLQGGLGVGGEVSQVNGWGIPRILQQDDLEEELDRYLKDTFIIVSPHIQSGQYFDQQAAVQQVIDEVLAAYNANPRQVYLTGLSRGGSGTWGLASRMPGVFAAVAPIAGGIQGIKDYSQLADIPIWIAHNTGDEVFDYNDTASIVRMLEGLAKVEFHRIDAPTPPGSAYLEQERVLISVDVADHDAWSDVYNDPSFYRWMLTHHLDD